jgi:acetoin utilization protein AcuB
MVPDPYVVAFDAPLSEVVAELNRRRIGSALVVRHGKLAGILSVMDVCRILASLLDAEFPAKGGNDAA